MALELRDRGPAPAALRVVFAGHAVMGDAAVGVASDDRRARLLQGGTDDDGAIRLAKAIVRTYVVPRRIGAAVVDERHDTSTQGGEAQCLAK